MNHNTSIMTRAAGILVSGMFLLSGCIGNFEELNTHPTDLDPDNMTPTERVGSLFPAMIDLLNPDQENDNQHIEQMIAGQYGGYFATTAPWNGTNFGTYNPSGDWLNQPYSVLFTGFYSNYFEIVDNTDATGYLYEWANILRVAITQRVADIYGPIPYSKMGGGEFQVAYDDVSDLYHQMIDQLSESISFFELFVQDNGGIVSAIADYDTMYGGDFNKWLKYANSLKFRLAVRIADKDTEYAKTAMAEAMQSGMIESNTDNAYIATNDNPYRKASEDWNDLAVNATLSTYMNAYSDPRISSYMTQTIDGAYRGVRMGINNINEQTYGASKRFSWPNFTQSSPMPVFYAAETMFLKAEAALQGWIDGGEASAKSYYEQGIELSMQQYGVAIGNYLSGTDVPSSYTDPVSSRCSGTITGAPCVSWDASGNKLAKIITQKWIANYPIGLESWCDFRRTGYPIMFQAVDNLSGSGYMGDVDNARMVRRLIYPQSERDNNSANVQAAVNSYLGGQDIASVDLWWASSN